MPKIIESSVMRVSKKDGSPVDLDEFLTAFARAAYEVQANIALKKEDHKHLFSYQGGEAKCECGMYLQPDGSITKKASGESVAPRKIVRFLKEFVVDAKYGMFVRACLTTDSILIVREMFKDLGELLDDLHCTIIYSNQPADLNIPWIDKHYRYGARTKHLEFWEGHDKEGYIVLKLDSGDLVALHERFREAGVIPSFKEYTPHISLVHPVSNPKLFEAKIAMINHSLAENPMHLDFYFGGYQIHDPPEYVDTFKND